MIRLLAFLFCALLFATSGGSAAEPRWANGTKAAPFVVNIEVRFSGERAAAAVRAVDRWGKIVRPLGLRLTTTRPGPLVTREPGNKNGRNEIYFYDIKSDNRWAEARLCMPVWLDDFKLIRECDIRLDLDPAKPYTAAQVYVVVLHEMGHLLGLGHLVTKAAMMNERGPAYLSDLQPADVAAVWKRYAKIDPVEGRGASDERPDSSRPSTLGPRLTAPR